jgi:hypothetical protein
MSQLSPEETFISVDVETSGPTPGDFSLLNLAFSFACVTSVDAIMTQL